MILVGSQRGGAGQLAAHLMNDRDNDHVAVENLRGFVADDLAGAFNEVHAISKGTRCKQFLFSLSVNPPKDASVGIEALADAADRAEAALGLTGHARAIVIHEKQGRRHAHVVWSRIDAREMKAVNLPFFKSRLKELSHDLYLEHGWELPDGHRTNGWKSPLNFTLAEWQQAKRIGLDPREIKQIFQQAWARSDNLPSLRHALEEHGYYLAKGDRRGFVAVDIHGEVFALARWAGVKTAEMRNRLGEPDRLPGVGDVRKGTRQRMSERLREFIREDRHNQSNQLRPLSEQREDMVASHRAERRHLDQRQAERWRIEATLRQARLHRGFRGVWELLTGEAAVIRRRNDQESYLAYQRDRDQREELFKAQMTERRQLQDRIDAITSRHRQERLRLARRIATALRHAGQSREPLSLEHSRSRPRNLDMGI